MDASTVTAIGVSFLVAYVLFRDVWKPFVKWADERSMEEPSMAKTPEQPKVVQSIPEKKEVAQPVARRRMGIAEMRRNAEIASQGPVEHQKKVTENNIKALEGM